MTKKPMQPPTEAELDDVLLQLLPRDVPYGINGVKHTQFSLARYSGVVKVGEHLYTYFPEQDQLWRNDVLKTVVRLREEAAKADKAAAKASQEVLL